MTILFAEEGSMLTTTTLQPEKTCRFWMRNVGYLDTKLLEPGTAKFCTAQNESPKRREKMTALKIRELASSYLSERVNWIRIHLLGADAPVWRIGKNAMFIFALAAGIACRLLMISRYEIDTYTSHTDTQTHTTH